MTIPSCSRNMSVCCISTFDILHTLLIYIHSFFVKDWLIIENIPAVFFGITVTQANDTVKHVSLLSSCTAKRYGLFTRVANRYFHYLINKTGGLFRCWWWYTTSKSKTAIALLWATAISFIIVVNVKMYVKMLFLVLRVSTKLLIINLFSTCSSATWNNQLFIQQVQFILY